MIFQVHKRDSSIRKFDKDKLFASVRSAFLAVREHRSLASKEIDAAVNRIVRDVKARFHRHEIGSEEIRSAVECALLEHGFVRTAEVYMDSAGKRRLSGPAKLQGPALSPAAVAILEKRYLQKDCDGVVIETPDQMFRRVAGAVAAAERKYKGGADKAAEYEKRFYDLMVSLDFIPNSPTLMNAGTKNGQLSACFVLPVLDSLDSVFNSLKYMAIIHQTGGGTGFSFSQVRPRGDLNDSGDEISHGPVGFIRMFDHATHLVDGKRNGANIAILDVDHPDIMEFITAKKDEGALTSFNLSVSVTDSFMRKVRKGGIVRLRNPRTGEVESEMQAKDLFRLIVTMAWNNGDPGLIFIDRINRFNPTPELGRIEATNPCGEQPLLPYESCNLGSINVGQFTRMKDLDGIPKRDVDWERLEDAVHLAVRFLDDVLDVNSYPSEAIRRMSLENRKIGLGIMGFADLLVRLNIPYGSEGAVKVAKKLMRRFYHYARDASELLGKRRGSFHNLKHSRVKGKYRHMRNATVTAIAPTGSISIIAGCSSGIEPLFGISYIRTFLSGEQVLETNPDFGLYAKKEGFYSRELMRRIARTGSVKDMKKIPLRLRRIFQVAHEISPEWHIRMQSAFQLYTDSAVSKTVNLPVNATVDDVAKAFMLAWKSGCKGITVYRHSSHREQVLSFGKEMAAHHSYSGGCAKKECPF